MKRTFIIIKRSYTTNFIIRINFAILEKQVAKLKQENENLRRSRDGLGEQLSNLKHEFSMHFEHGCKVLHPELDPCNPDCLQPTIQHRQQQPQPLQHPQPSHLEQPLQPLQPAQQHLQRSLEVTITSSSTAAGVDSVVHSSQAGSNNPDSTCLSWLVNRNHGFWKWPYDTSGKVIAEATWNTSPQLLLQRTQ